MKRPFVHHYWRYVGNELVRIHWLTRARPGEHGEIQTSRPIQADVYECRACGLVHATRRVEEDDRTTYPNAYGIDRDSLASTSSPSCEVWQRPATPEADDAREAA
jgi:hypothetical protein